MPDGHFVLKAGPTSEKPLQANFQEHLPTLYLCFRSQTAADAGATDRSLPRSKLRLKTDIKLGSSRPFS